MSVVNQLAFFVVQEEICQEKEQSLPKKYVSMEQSTLRKVVGKQP